MDAALYTSIWNGCHLSVKLRYLPFVKKKGTGKEYRVLSKMVHERVRNWTSRRNLPEQTFVEYPHGLETPFWCQCIDILWAISSEIISASPSATDYKLQTTISPQFFFSIVQLWKKHSSSSSLFIPPPPLIPATPLSIVSYWMRFSAPHFYMAKPCFKVLIEVYFK